MNIFEELEKKLKKCKFCFHKDNCEENIKITKKLISLCREKIKEVSCGAGCSDCESWIKKIDEVLGSDSK